MGSEEQCFLLICLYWGSFRGMNVQKPEAAERLECFRPASNCPSGTPLVPLFSDKAVVLLSIVSLISFMAS